MITLKDVCKEYTPGVPALEHVNIHIEQGEFVFVVGDSGSGKSTLIKLLLKELEPTSGDIRVKGKSLSQIRRRQIPHYRRNIGCVFQDFRLLEDRNVYENVAFAQRVTAVKKRHIKKNVPRILSLVGLASKYRSKPRQLSGGEQQRVAIARALINQPAILLADEPTGNLDENTAWEIMRLLDIINKRGTTVLMVTHNMKIVEEMKKRVITLQMGNIVSDDAPEPEEGADLPQDMPTPAGTGAAQHTGALPKTGVSQRTGALPKTGVAQTTAALLKEEALHEAGALPAQDSRPDAEEAASKLSGKESNGPDLGVEVEDFDEELMGGEDDAV